MLLSIILLAATIHAESFDYVIIGGGTAGLTVAARLSEDPRIAVAVLEAGEDRSEDIDILAPGLLTSLYSNPKYDWNYHTIPQKHANNHVIAHARGKQLGGSSAINFLWWTHASQQDIDNWGLLGNANWSWNALDPFFRKSESYIQPSSSIEEALQTEYIDPSIHGDDGPVLTTFPDIFGEFDEAWPRAYEALGLGVTSDPRDGLAIGGYTNLLNFDPKTRSRSYAATTYLADARDRPNLKVVTSAHVQKILFDTRSNKPRATGVSFTRNNTTQIFDARKEVILSAGTFGSPQILELSGIGNSAILKKHGVQTIVANDNVGENLQDHAYVPIGLEVRPGIFTLDDFANETLFNEAYEEYVSNRTGLLATTGAQSALLSLEQIGAYDYPGLKASIDEHCHRSPHPNDQHHQHFLPSPPPPQHAILCHDIHTEAISQEIAVVGGMNPQSSNDSSKLFYASTPGNFFTISGVLEHPFSRGSIHIASPNPSIYPVIDPNYLSHPLDIELLAAITLHLQTVARTPPLSDLLVGNGTKYQPGYYELNTQNVEDWVKDNLQTEDHPCGTCAMLPEHEGGVVDERFRVHGVEGLRVVDASVIPLIPRANLQSLVYAIAERAAEFVREERVGMGR